MHCSYYYIFFGNILRAEIQTGIGDYSSEIVSRNYSHTNRSQPSSENTPDLALDRLFKDI